MTAVRYHRGLPVMELKWDADQPRDEHGRFVEDQGPSPLDYTPSSYLHPDRLAVIDPQAGEHPKGDAYFAEQRRTTMVGVSGRRLKNPRQVVTPGAKPGTVAFLDYTKPFRDTLYLNYMKTRSDQRGQGHGARLVEAAIAAHPEVRVVDFGRIMHPAADKIRRATAAAHPELRVTGKRDY